MKRRAALAMALCLTVIVGFFIVGYGTQVGFFGGHRGPDDAAAQADPTAVPTQPPAAAPSQPQVIEELVYRDVYVSGGDAGSSGSAGTSGGSAAPTPSQGAARAPANPPAPTPTPAQPAANPTGHSVEFSGEVTAVSGSTLTVDTQSGEYSVKLDGNTSVHGQIEVGARVSVHGYQGTDGIVVANEIEVSGDD